MLAIATSILMYGGLFISLFFEVFLLITYIEKRNDIAKALLPRTLTKVAPSVSIIVPCYNEETTVTKTVCSILELDYPKDKLKILVVDDGSNDNTIQVLEQFADNPQVEVYSKENGGKYTALNFALTKVTSDLVGCLDADSFVAPDALMRIVSHFEDPEVMVVTPSVTVHNPKGILQLIQRVEYGWGVFIKKMYDYLDAIYITPGPFSIFRVEIFQKLGGYAHAHQTEDLEIALRLQSNHYKIVNAHDAAVYTITPKTLRGLYHQRARWTYGFLNNMIDYRHLLFKREYGNMSMYVLPMAIITIFTALYFTATFVINLIFKIVKEAVKIQTVGFHPSFSKLLEVHWFFLNTSSPMFIVLVVSALSLGIIFISRVMSEGKFRLSWDILYFLTLYYIIVPLWVTKALFHTVFTKSISWR